MVTLPFARSREKAPLTETAPPEDPTTLMARLRRMGQGLALPIAALPAAGLLLRLGQPDLLGRFEALHQIPAVISGAGAAILDYLPALFAVGIALGLNRAKDAAGPVIACLTSYLILARVVLVLNPLPDSQLDTPPARWPYGALAGIIGGLLAMAIWKRVAGRRGIPAFAAYGIIAVAAILAGSLLGIAYPAVDRALTASAATVADHAVIGGGAFGFLNRLLTPIGLHQPLNAVVWYLTGDCGNGIKGDMPCFIQAHDPDAGVFMGGFFPVSMAGLPAAALAMWRSALPDQRRRVAALLLPAAAISALAGVTEPIELTFAFIAFPLYLVHAVLTGLSLALVNLLDIHAGFVFSAGALDYVFNYSISTRPLLLLPIALAYGAIYYALFRFAIVRFNLRTPGREPAPAGQDEATAPTAPPDRHPPSPATRRTAP
ncbi:PTS transporter subunit EIIC [Streptomyces sp. NBC_01264]|uniref:PTS transporter subunit EIIC n=1 Tax=Streptomyces sp. NBC_01264 TaxID=2903804 RepID=UPI00225344D8|nr:PTS transporter subunit EIIC [Streptomyces sp. NBC_01264]MCX4783932.1 PTS transporter subunit EIIC [Streptomyces sp. NBC_01264]